MRPFGADKKAPISLAGVLMIRIFVGAFAGGLAGDAMAALMVRVLAADRGVFPGGRVRGGGANVIMVPATPDQGVDEKDRSG